MGHAVARREGRPRLQASRPSAGVQCSVCMCVCVYVCIYIHMSDIFIIISSSSIIISIGSSVCVFGNIISCNSIAHQFIV